ncbi:hypothetical protein [Streptomyces axinellae]|uniref:Uncharacterized protein n=1 Tax=Streptomyces axinellae TaxID=552788 RepID=A0ABN3PVZ8_9ACTN
MSPTGEGAYQYAQQQNVRATVQGGPRYGAPVGFQAAAVQHVQPAQNYGAMPAYPDPSQTFHTPAPHGLATSPRDHLPQHPSPAGNPAYAHPSSSTPYNQFATQGQGANQRSLARDGDGLRRARTVAADLAPRKRHPPRW